MARVLWSPKAIAELYDILDFITERSGSHRADLIAARIVSTLANLSAAPRSGRMVDGHDGQRRFAIQPWIVFFTPLPDGIRVNTIVDGRRDLPMP